MVQKEVTRKAQVYGLVGILSAIVLVAMIYSLGAFSPQVTTEPHASPAPPGENTNYVPSSQTSILPMKSFTSTEDIKNYIISNSQGGEGRYVISSQAGASDQSGLGVSPTVPSEVPAQPTPMPAPTTTPNLSQETSAAKDYSATNIQVAGVDEADTVKTDGNFLYFIANNTVYIMNADPQNAKIVSKIDVSSNAYLTGVYLSGDRLAVLGNQYMPYILESKEAVSSIMPYMDTSRNFVYIYNIADRTNPVLARNFTISGNYFNSRMIGNNIYTIVTESVYLVNDAVNVPVVYDQTRAVDMAPSKIFYAPWPASYYTYTTVIGLNILNDNQAPIETTIMMGGASNMYVSTSNIYVTYPTWNPTGETTNIYRIRIGDNALVFEARGQVPGYVINQYAMDEFNSNFRVATTQTLVDNATTADGAVFKVTRQANSIYILNPNLAIVGGLERFKMDESLYAARFVGNKCYVVTFKRIDPFFVIDLSNPALPKVAGELKIPGYSSYLHPYDENHIIGVGEENNTVKLSLFDVTNVNAPTETAKYTLDSSWSNSPVSYDPHAFLFNLQKQLLVIPVSINNMVTIMPVLPPVSNDTVGKAVPTPTTAPSLAPSRWQGVYVFKINPTDGFTLRGNVTQIDDLEASKNNYYYWSSSYDITRALYIDNTLYTLSNGRVQLNSLDNFALVAKVDIT